LAQNFLCVYEVSLSGDYVLIKSWVVVVKGVFSWVFVLIFASWLMEAQFVLFQGFGDGQAIFCAHDVWVSTEVWHEIVSRNLGSIVMRMVVLSASTGGADWI
jgi:hypothetical protein